MKNSTLFASLVLVVSMFFATASAFAVPTWSSYQNSTNYGALDGQQVNSVTISLTSDNKYNITMALGRAPVIGTTYSVLLGNSPSVFSNPNYYVDATASSKYSSFAVSFGAGNITNNSFLQFAPYWDGNKTLSWMVSKNDLFGGNDFWFAGQSKPTYGLARKPDAIFSTTKVTATPIPGVAWLLGSGILGLMSLRRRSKDSK